MNQPVFAIRILSGFLALASLAGAEVNPPSSPQKCSPQESPEVGRVLTVSDGIVVVARDASLCLAEGMRIGFRDEMGNERIVGTIAHANKSSYHVRVHMSEDVHVGELAYLTIASQTGSLPFPPRSSYVVEAALAAKPWLGLGGNNSGVLLEGHVAWQPSPRLRLTAAVAPAIPNIGIASGALEAYVAPSVTFDVAELVLGVGVGTHDSSYPTRSGLGVLLSPILRIGAEDGLMFRIRSSAIWSNSTPLFGSLRIDTAIPVRYGARLLAGGGGGDSGYAYGEIGLELLMAGNGLGGSWFGSGLLGYGGVKSTGETSASGPYIGLEVKKRF